VKLDDNAAVKDEARDLRDRLEDLARRNADLARVMEQAPGDGREGDPRGAALIALRASLAEEQIAVLGRWVDLLTRRLTQSERRWCELADLVAGHEEGLRLVAAALKEIDDPYGFGESLDERIGTDDLGSTWGFEEGAS
jgi:hypothetical protein